MDQHAAEPIKLVKPISVSIPGVKRNRFDTAFRVIRYIIIRGIALLSAVVISVFLTILISNRQLIIESEIEGNLLKGWLPGIAGPTRVKFPTASQRVAEELYGSAETDLGKNLVLLYKGMTLNLGESQKLYYYSGDTLIDDVGGIIRDALPRTLLLFGTANFLLFFVTITIALALARMQRGWLDKALTFLAPISSIPSWMYGLILTVVFARVFHYFVGGVWNSWPAEFRIEHIPIVAKSLMLPILAILISKFFQSIYSWRTFFQINSGEDFVEMGKAKGLPNRTIMGSYILRPTLPAIITSFVLIIILIWQEAIVIELFFGVAGIGHLFYSALRVNDLPLVVGLTVTFAYLLALSVFLLDVIYALVDPRVKVAGEGEIVAKSSAKRKKIGLPFPARLSLHMNSESRKQSRKRFRLDLSARLKSLRGNLLDLVEAYRRVFVDIRRNRIALIGLVIILILVLVSFGTILAVPYNQAISMWRGDDDIWYRNPDRVAPAWTNLFRKEKLPSTIILNSEDGTANKEIVVIPEGFKDITVSFVFNYPYDGYPQDLKLFLKTNYEHKRPFLTYTWITPDGKQIDLGSYSMDAKESKFSIAGDEKLMRKFGEVPPQEALFADPTSEGGSALQGNYELRVSALTFEQDTDLDAEFVLYGQVYGLAGTDHLRRDLTLGLLWGTPVALAFGLLAAVLISFSTMAIAALGAWYGGWLDRVIQWITEVNMVLPVFPILLMVFNYYSMRLWTILGVTVLLSIFGASVKTYRSVFLQVKEAPFIEAARTYGASNMRIIGKYLVPRIVVILIPQLIILVPTFVFLETTFAYLGMSDPLLPTWGKIIREALAYGGLSVDYYWLLEPLSLLFITAFAFLVLGYSLERIFDPRLRER